MKTKNQISKLISDFPSRAVFADEVGQKLATVHKWAQTGRIPSEHQEAVLRAVRARRIRGINAAWMVKAHAAPSQVSP